jgi:hypothetical protein
MTFGPQGESKMEMTTPTATPRETGDLLNADLREERLARMTPERRALYHRIVQRREKMGAVERDLIASLKDLRAND